MHFREVLRYAQDDRSGHKAAGITGVAASKFAIACRFCGGSGFAAKVALIGPGWGRFCCSTRSGNGLVGLCMLMNNTKSLVDACPALVLNADFRPLSYFPLSLWSWQDTIKAVFLDRVNIVSEYEQKVHSPNFEMALPSVVSLKRYVKPARYPAFTRFNLFLRDGFTCQYCTSREELTFDHVVPRSRGGRTTWQNVVAACSCCNLRKGAMLDSECGMHLRRQPFRPTNQDLQRSGRAFPPNYLHQSWVDYLYWDSELES